MMPLESSVSDATIWYITLELPSKILEALFTIIYDVYSTGVTYDVHNMFIESATAELELSESML